MTGSEALRRAVVTLRDAGVGNAPLDARLLLAHAIGVARDRLTLALQEPLDDRAESAFFTLIAERAARRPVSHILGGRLFFDRLFRVTADVLDPRPETETLVVAALERPFDRVLDLGTGSGCLLISLLAESPHATGIGTDVSREALLVARANAEALGVLSRAAFGQSDWLSAACGQFDLIVSNPPYIAAEEMPDLAAELRREPRMALTDEGDGLSAYRVIARDAPAHLAPGGWLMVEIGPKQGAVVAGLFAAAGLESVTIRRDLDDRDRVVAARAPGPGRAT